MNPALQYSRTQSGQIENLLEAKNSSISAVEISSNNSPYSGCFHVKPVSNNRSPKLRRPNSHLERCLFSQSHKEERHEPNTQSTDRQMAYVISYFPLVWNVLVLLTKNHEVPRVDDGRVKKKTSASMDKGMTSITLYRTLKMGHGFRESQASLSFQWRNDSD